MNKIIEKLLAPAKVGVDIQVADKSGVDYHRYNVRITRTYRIFGFGLQNREEKFFVNGKIAKKLVADALGVEVERPGWSALQARVNAQPDMWCVLGESTHCFTWSRPRKRRRHPGILKNLA